MKHLFTLTLVLALPFFSFKANSQTFDQPVEYLDFIRNFLVKISIKNITRIIEATMITEVDASAKLLLSNNIISKKKIKVAIVMSLFIRFFFLSCLSVL